MTIRRFDAVRKSVPGLAAVLVAALLLAPGVRAEEKLVERASMGEIDRALKVAEGHPNEQWRLRGMRAYQQGHPDEAADYWQRAAEYADKYSQHRLSLLYWDGEGVARDRVQAYIWSDLAAERGNTELLAIREKMWGELSDAERERVLADGAGYYDRYGDAVAKPRLAKEMKRFARNMTGSRVGFDNSPRSMMAGGPIHGSFGNATPGMFAASQMVAGNIGNADMYGEERVDPERYWQTQDALNAGQVDVGALKTEAEADEPDADPR